MSTNNPIAAILSAYKEISSWQSPVGAKRSEQ